MTAGIEDDTMRPAKVMSGLVRRLDIHSDVDYLKTEAPVLN